MLSLNEILQQLIQEAENEILAVPSSSSLFLEDLKQRLIQELGRESVILTEFLREQKPPREKVSIPLK